MRGVKDSGDRPISRAGMTKTAISIPEELRQSVKEYAGDKPFSVAVCDLLRVALGLAPEVIPGDTGITENFNSLTNEVNRIKERLAALESERVIPSNTEVIPEKETVIPEDIPMVIPDDKPEEQVPEKVIPESYQSYTIERIQTRVEELKPKYGSYSKILVALGRNPRDNVISRLMKTGIHTLTDVEVRRLMEEL